MDFLEKEGKVKGIWETSGVDRFKESNIFKKKESEYSRSRKKLSLPFSLFAFPFISKWRTHLSF